MVSWNKFKTNVMLFFDKCVINACLVNLFILCTQQRGKNILTERSPYLFFLSSVAAAAKSFEGQGPPTLKHLQTAAPNGSCQLYSVVLQCFETLSPSCKDMLRSLEKEKQ